MGGGVKRTSQSSADLCACFPEDSMMGREGKLPARCFMKTDRLERGGAIVLFQDL